MSFRGRGGGRGGGGRGGGGRGGGFRGGRGGGGRGGGGGRQQDMGPPESVVELGYFTHPCEEQLVCKCTNEKIPYFNAPVYFENKEQIGQIDEVFGSLKEHCFSVKLGENMKASSFKVNQKLYINPFKLLPVDRFLPQAKGAKSPSRGGRGGARGGGRGGFDRGGRGGFDRGRGGRGGFDRGRGGGTPGGPPGACFKCGESGHMSRECPQGGGGGGGAASTCFKCNQTGHFSRECPSGGGNACFKCGKEGHMSRDCDQAGGGFRGGRGGGGRGRGGGFDRGAKRPSFGGTGANAETQNKKMKFDD